MPPPIQRRMQVSAVGFGCSIFSAASRGRGSPPARVASAAALMPRRKFRRFVEITLGFTRDAMVGPVQMRAESSESHNVNAVGSNPDLDLFKSSLEGFFDLPHDLPVLGRIFHVKPNTNQLVREDS